MTCPDENTLVAMVEGELDEASRATLDAHLDTCPACATLAIELAHILTPLEPDDLTQIGRYQVRGLLGQGGMGVVYEGYDTGLERRVAIKLMRADILEQAQRAIYTERLLREARLLATVSHPNVLTVYEVGEWGDEQVFLAMEYIEGHTLRDWVEREEPSWQMIVERYLQAAAGLHAAHLKGLIHRDVKPDNLLVDHDGRVRVMDFGLARSLSAPREEVAPVEGRAALMERSSLTMTGMLLGTPAYMAPEQHAHGEVGPAADQFALCVSLWEALGGKRPFVASSRRALVELMQTSRPVRPGELVDVPEALWLVLERGLAMEPERRWPSMRALAQALEQATRVEPPASKRWLDVAGIAAVVAVVSALALRGGAGDQASPAPDQEAAPEVAAAAAVVAPRDPVVEELEEPDPLDFKHDRWSCEPGFVYSDGDCLRPHLAPHFLCAESDFAGCQAQCLKGNVESCNRFSKLFFTTHQLGEHWWIKAERAEQLAQIRALDGALVEMLSKSCLSDYEEAACALALLSRGAAVGEDTQPQSAEQAAQMFALAKEGCDLAELISCSFIIDTYAEGRFESYGLFADRERLEHLVGSSCEVRASRLCVHLSEFFYRGTPPERDRQVYADAARSAFYTSLACTQGVAESCLWGSLMYASRDVAACMRLFEQVARDTDGQVRSPWPSWTDRAAQERFCEQMARIYQPERAKELASKGCAMERGDWRPQSCSLAQALP